MDRSMVECVIAFGLVRIQLAAVAPSLKLVGGFTVLAFFPTRTLCLEPSHLCRTMHRMVIARILVASQYSRLAGTGI